MDRNFHTGSTKISEFIGLCSQSCYSLEGYIINFSVVEFIFIETSINPMSIFCKSQLKVTPCLAVKYGASGMRTKNKTTNSFE
jgi:hypothetical protein